LKLLLYPAGPRTEKGGRAVLGAREREGKFSPFPKKEGRCAQPLPTPTRKERKNGHNAAVRNAYADSYSAGQRERKEKNKNGRGIKKEKEGGCPRTNHLMQEKGRACVNLEKREKRGGELEEAAESL